MRRRDSLGGDHSVVILVPGGRQRMRLDAVVESPGGGQEALHECVLSGILRDVLDQLTRGKEPEPAEQRAGLRNRRHICIVLVCHGQAKAHGRGLQKASVCQAKADHSAAHRVESFAALGKVLDGPVGDAVVGGVARRRELEAFDERVFCARREVRFHAFF